MIDFNAEIKSGESLANIVLNSNVSIYLKELYEYHEVVVKNYTLPDSEIRTAYWVDSTITITTKADGAICSLGCNKNYKGAYRKTFRTGMFFYEIAELSKRQRIFNGSLILEEDFGISYVIPSPFDEIADSIQDIPANLRLDEIYISDFSSWVK
ncbi:hypothetical protein [Pseudomonas veronii]|uniref:hypothetical protein n=1 Tax=Pseudomonas veronii TaxID=76761 RepID=UPI002657AE2A|nr:hypothetical protein [Pseudomonas veronii]WKC46782.1 hypothetical protein QYP03_28895 [Pseudomonas veronii]